MREDGEVELLRRVRARACSRRQSVAAKLHRLRTRPYPFFRYAIHYPLTTLVALLGLPAVVVGGVLAAPALFVWYVLLPALSWAYWKVFEIFQKKKTTQCWRIVETLKKREQELDTQIAKILYPDN